MDQVLLSVAYIVASILFILSLRGLSSQETARKSNLLGLTGFDYASSEDVREELRHELAASKTGVASGAEFVPGRLAAMDVTRETAIYAVDPVVRRSAPLQATADGQAGATAGAA